MAYPYQISSFEQYQQEYRRSVDDPEGFWSGVADHFYWHKNGTRYPTGISLNLK